MNTKFILISIVIALCLTYYFMSTKPIITTPTIRPVINPTIGPVIPTQNSGTPNPNESLLINKGFIKILPGENSNKVIEFTMPNSDLTIYHNAVDQNKSIVNQMVTGTLRAYDAYGNKIGSDYLQAIEITNILTITPSQLLPGSKIKYELFQNVRDFPIYIWISTSPSPSL